MSRIIIEKTTGLKFEIEIYKDETIHINNYKLNLIYSAALNDTKNKVNTSQFIQDFMDDKNIYLEYTEEYVYLKLYVNNISVRVYSIPQINIDESVKYDVVQNKHIRQKPIADMGDIERLTDELMVFINECTSYRVEAYMREKELKKEINVLKSQVDDILKQLGH
jgi:hypothetical protein